MKYLHVYKSSLLALLFIVLLASSCRKKEEQQNTIYEVKIGEALKENSTVLLSEFVDGEVEYVALESGKNHLLAKNPHFYTTETEILTFAKNQIYVFDRKTGKFLREIGHYGRDPGAYKKVVQTFPFDEEKQLVYTGGLEPKSFFRYNVNGEYFDKVFSRSKEIEPDMIKNIFGEIVTSIAPVNDTCFIGYVWNINGKQEAKLIVFNDNNYRIKSYPQHKRFDFDINRDGLNVFSWNAKYYQLNQQLHFFERFTDTLFMVSVDTLQAKFILNRGITENTTASDFSSDKGIIPYSLIENIFESERFLFFKIRVAKETKNSTYYYGYYDKKEETTRISTDESGIINDIDNFIPLKFHSANSKDEIIGSLDAYEVKMWFDGSKEKAAKLPPHLQKLKNIKDTDNPIVVIAKLKD